MTWWWGTLWPDNGQLHLWPDDGDASEPLADGRPSLCQESGGAAAVVPPEHLQCPSQWLRCMTIVRAPASTIVPPEYLQHWFSPLKLAMIEMHDNCESIKENRYPLNLLRQAQFCRGPPLGWPGPQSVKVATLLRLFHFWLTRPPFILLSFCLLISPSMHHSDNRRDPSSPLQCQSVARLPPPHHRLLEANGRGTFCEFLS